MHAPAQPQHKPDIERDVQPVHPQLQHQHRPRALLRNEPACNAIERNSRWRRPDAHRHILPRQAFHFRTGRGDLERGPKQHPLQSDNHHPRAQTNQQRAGEQGRNFAAIALPFGLRRKANSPHPQKSENPVKRREDHRTNAHRANRCRQPHLPDHARIHCTKDRHSRIGQHDRHRKVQHTFVGEFLCFGRAHNISRAARASQNVPSPARTSGPYYPATPLPERRHSAARPV